jgi:hypothetical protein
VLSRSAFAPHLFGDRLNEFEADLRALFAEAFPSGTYRDHLRDTELRIWRR